MDPVSLFLQPLGEYLITQVATLMKDECVTILNVNEKLKDLLDTMTEMKGILEAAAGKSMKTDHGNNLLRKLNEAFYDAEDLLADCLVAAQQLRRPFDAENDVKVVKFKSLSVLSYPKEFCVRHKFGWKVKQMASKIQGVFDKIKDDYSRALDFQQCQPKPQGVCRATEDTHGMMFEGSSGIVGVDEKESRLVELLTRGSSSSNNAVAVYAITGMAGIGKSTLARKVFNSQPVKTQFEVCEWVCVSRNCDVSELLRQVIRQVSRKDTIDATQMAELVPMLCNQVISKRVLLVLDDVWDAASWASLKEPLSKAARGSAVIITSRQKQREIANEAGAAEIMVNPMMEDDGWSLLCKVAFGEEDRQEDILSFKTVGLEIVKKCRGVPLFIKAIGGSLKNKRNVQQWLKVSRNSIWHSNLPEERKSLLLSYSDLDYQHKLCFTFCSLFPESFKFHNQNLVQLWVAEGFMDGSSTEEIEEEGERCYKELITRNLLQEAPEYFDGKGCTMHDLMRDLGHSLISVGSDIYDPHPMAYRHSYYVQKDLTEFPRISGKPTSLRTLMLSRNPSFKILDGSVLKKLMHLRVLDLSYTGIETLPSTLGELIQLRHLNLSFSRLKALPLSIGELSNLQSLLVNGSKHLKTLPNEVARLQNLRHLNVGSGLSQLVSLPTGIGKLMQLRTLQGFAVNYNASVKELKTFSKLTCLSLYQLEKIACKEDAKEAALMDKMMLTYLKLSSTPITDVDAEAMDMDKINNIHLIYEALEPPRNLEAIHIEGFSGQNFPSWIREQHLSRLKWLRFEDCKLCLQLPPLGQLQCLKVLDIRGAVAVQKIGSEFFGNGFFPKLEELYFIRLSEFLEWSGLREGALPCLKKLHILKCPKFAVLPRGLSHVSSLEELVIEELTSLRTIKKLPSVLELRITRNPNLKNVQNLPLLKLMYVCRCPSLTKIENIKALKHLVFLDHRMEALPEWLVDMSKLQRLDVKGNNSLVSRCYKDNEDWYKIKHIQRVEVRHYKEDMKAEAPSPVPDTTHEKKRYISYTKDPYSFDSNYGPNIQDGSFSSHV